MAGSMSGIAMLLPLPRKEQQALIAGVRKLPPTEERASSPRRILERSRRHGFGVNRGDVVPGLAGIAVPLMDAVGWPFAAIGIMGPTGMFAGDRVSRLGETLRDDAYRIAHQHAELISELHHTGEGQGGKRPRQS